MLNRLRIIRGIVVEFSATKKILGTWKIKRKARWKWPLKTPADSISWVRPFEEKLCYQLVSYFAAAFLGSLACNCSVMRLNSEGFWLASRVSTCCCKPSSLRFNLWKLFWGERSGCFISSKPYWTQRMQCNFFLWQNCGTKVTNRFLLNTPN